MAPRKPSIIAEDEINLEIVLDDAGQEGLEQFCNQETLNMDSTVINQDPRAVVVSTEDGHRNHGHHGWGFEHRNHLDELIAREQAAFGRGAAVDAQTTMRDVKDTRFDLAGVTNSAAAAAAVAACHTDQLVQSTSCRTDGIVQSGFGQVHDRLCDGFDKTRGAVSHASERTTSELCALQKQLSDTATATVVGFKDAQAISYQIEGRASLDAAKNSAALGLQATTNANALSVEATKNFYALNVEIAKNAAAAELRAQQIAATAAAQAAECCCELKALITADGNATRGLINNNTIEQLRAQLVATQRLIPVTIPVGAG